MEFEVNKSVPISSRWKFAFKVVPYTSDKIWSARLIFLFFLAVCLNISTVINIKILTNSNQQTRSYKFTSHIAAFLSVVLITEMLEICIQTSYQNVQLILKSYLPVLYGTHLTEIFNTRSLFLQDSDLGLRLWCFMPLSTIFQLYCGSLERFHYLIF